MRDANAEKGWVVWLKMASGAIRSISWTGERIEDATKLEPEGA